MTETKTGYQTDALTLQQLVDKYDALEQMTADLSAELRDVEYELLKRMEAEGATEAVGSEGHKAVLKRPVSYDSQSLHVLLELLPEEELRTTGAFIPAHDETVHHDDAWNMTRLKPFEKRGAVIANTIEKAKLYGSPKVRIERG